MIKQNHLLNTIENGYPQGIRHTQALRENNCTVQPLWLPTLTEFQIVQKRVSTRDTPYCILYGSSHNVHGPISRGGDNVRFKKCSKLNVFL